MVVVAFVLLLTVIPVTIAARLTGGGGITRASAGTTGGPVAAGPAGGEAGDAQASVDVALGANEP